MIDRRLGLRLPAVLAIAAAIASVVLFLPVRGSDHGILARAAAAIGGGEVLHMKTQTPSGVVSVNLRTGRRTVEQETYEIWYDTTTKRTHLVLRFRGLVGDALLPDDASTPGVTVGQLDPAFLALATGYQQALASGEATLEGSGTVLGHEVYWLRFPPVQQDQPGSEVAVDTATYRPVLLRTWTSKTQHVDERVLVAETKDFDPADFSRVGVRLVDALGDGSTSQGSVSTGGGPKRITAPWLTPGRAPLGLPLSAVGTATTTTRGRTVRGIVLFYGARNGNLGVTPLQITEYRRPDDPAFWKAIPRDTISIEQGESSGPSGSHKTWTGSAVRHGIYVTIDTARGEHAVVTIARALHRAPRR